MKTLSYQLGYNTAKAPKSSINYQAKMIIPINSFSHPKLQIPDYIKGWEDGKNG